jgi:hypothetical protein
MRVLVALKPRAYRDALVHAIKRTRRRVAVHFLDPDLLDYETRYLEPQVVICDQVMPAVREYAICWVEIPYCDPPRAVVNIKGQAEIVPDISIDELISVIDRAEALARRRADADSVQASLL